MGFIKNVLKTTAGIVTGGLSGTLDEGLEGLANDAGNLFNRATGATQANQWQWDMWNAQNAYNTPLAQRQRLIEAGYNPALAYNSGSAGGSAGSMTAKQGSGSSGLNPLDFLGRLGQLSSVNSQAEVNSSNARVLDQTARRMKHENDLVENTPFTVSDKSDLALAARGAVWGTKQLSSVAGSIFGRPNTPGTTSNNVEKSAVLNKYAGLKPGNRLDQAFAADQFQNRLDQMRTRELAKLDYSREAHDRVKAGALNLPARMWNKYSGKAKDAYSWFMDKIGD